MGELWRDNYWFQNSISDLRPGLQQAIIEIGYFYFEVTTKGNVTYSVSEASYSIVVGWISIEEFCQCQDTRNSVPSVETSACAVSQFHGNLAPELWIKPT